MHFFGLFCRQLTPHHCLRFFPGTFAGRLATQHLKSSWFDSHWCIDFTVGTFACWVAVVCPLSHWSTSHWLHHFSLGFLRCEFDCQWYYLFLVGSHFPVGFAAELFPQCSLWVSQLQQVEVPSSRSLVDRLVLSVFLGDPTTIASFFC